MTTWRARFQMWLLITGMMVIHAAATESLPNTPEAMLMFHGSAALLDWLLLCIAPKLLSGRLCDHTQWLLLTSICGNSAGWILYMRYAPPSYYNSFMWWLTAAQWVRLFIPDRHDADHLWSALVRHFDRSISGFHS